MNTTTHPNTEALAAFLADPQAAEFEELSLHLASCGDCRSQVKVLSALQENPAIIDSAYRQPAAGDTADLEQAMQQQQIEYYVDGQLQGEEKQHTATLLQDNPLALKAALHYACHSSAMRGKAAGSLNGSTSGQRSKNRREHLAFMTAVRHWLRLRTPVWLAVPTTAIVTVTLLLVLLPRTPHYAGDFTIASYQDNAVIQFQKKNQSPGIGFFSNAHKTIKPYNNMQVKLVSGHSIALFWPAVEKAKSYTLRLQMFKNGQKITLGEVTTTTTHAEFTNIDTNANLRYEWVLSGETTDKKTFYTSGGFVINHHDN